MSVYYLVVEQPVPDVVFEASRMLTRAFKKLDRLARKLQVTPLSEFYSMDPNETAAMLEELGADPPEEGLPPEQWFAATDGQRSVRALLEALAQQPDYLRFTADAVKELTELERVLGRLAQAQVRWHWAIDV